MLMMTSLFNNVPAKRHGIFHAPHLIYVFWSITSIKQITHFLSLSIVNCQLSNRRNWMLSVYILYCTSPNVIVWNVSLNFVFPFCRFTMSMVLCCWFSSFSLLLQSAWQLLERISCLMLRIITGNGHLSSQLPPRLYMCTCILCTTIMWRPRCQVSSRQASILVIQWCSALA